MFAGAPFLCYITIGCINFQKRIKECPMSKKISITMSDELHNRLSKVRDNFSISAICQEALDREIKIEELAKEGGNEETIIARLRLEKEKLQLSSRQEGQRIGIINAKNMPYTEIRAFVDLKDLYYYEKDGDYEGGESIKSLITHLCTTLPAEKEQQFEDYFMGIRWEGKDLRQYFIGFVNGVVSFYESIKEKIGDQDELKEELA
jgi:hypothetical protein